MLTAIVSSAMYISPNSADAEPISAPPDVSGNIEKLISIRSNLNNDIDILVAPELYVSGYPIDDLVLREDFLNLVESEINKLVQCTKDNKSAIIVGAPRKDNNHIKNSVFVIENGNIVSIKDKYELPNTGVFDEQRIFKQGSLEDCVIIKGIKFGLPICEDIWEKTVLEKLSKSGAEIIIAINASPVISPEAIKSPLFLPSSDAVLLAKWFNIPPINIGRVNSIGR